MTRTRPSPPPPRIDRSPPGGIGARDRSGHRSGLAERWRSLVRAASWHRRKLAALCAVAAVLTGLSALAPPKPDTVPAVRARADLPGGTVLAETDLRLDHLPRDALPTGALGDLGLAVGRTLAGRMPAGQVVAGADLVSGGFRGAGGRVIAPVRLSDSDLATLLSEGDLVDVVGGDEQTRSAEIVASGVRIVAVPPVSREAGSSAGGGLVLVEVTVPVAKALAAASASSQLGVIWR